MEDESNVQYSITVWNGNFDKQFMSSDYEKKIKASNDLDTEIMNLKSLKSFTILTNQRQCVSESKNIHGPEEYLSTWAIYFQNHHTKRNDYAINKILKPTCEDILEGNLT